MKQQKNLFSPVTVKLLIALLYFLWLILACERFYTIQVLWYLLSDYSDERDTWVIIYVQHLIKSISSQWPIKFTTYNKFTLTNVILNVISWVQNITQIIEVGCYCMDYRYKSNINFSNITFNTCFLFKLKLKFWGNLRLESCISENTEMHITENL